MRPTDTYNADTDLSPPVPLAQQRVPKLGIMEAKIWLADDWDSPETNEEIWTEFWENLQKPD
jgi:hypothetical protein